MPSERLPLRVEHFLLRACPSAVLATHDIVAEAVRRHQRDEDVISQLCREYGADRSGYPVGALPGRTSEYDGPTARRRRMLQNYYTVNGIETDQRRLDVICSTQDISDGVLLDALRNKYAKTELGEPYPGGDEGVNKAAALRWQVERMFLRAAPDRLQEAAGIGEGLRMLDGIVSSEDVLVSVRRSLGQCSDDGWPLDPHKRRLARIQRFFQNNDPARLHSRSSEITDLVNTNLSEHALFLMLFHEYGLDEVGNEYKADIGLQDDVCNILSRCNPLAASDDLIFTYLAFGQRKGLSAGDLLRLIRETFDTDEEGWPLDLQKRLLCKVTRYLMINAPEDVTSADAVLYDISGGTSTGAFSVSEDAIMIRLYERYGRDVAGRVVLNTPSIRHRVCEFLEEYVPEAEIERLADDAMRLGLFPDTLLHHLKEQYAAFTRFQYPLRQQLKLIYSRAAPNKIFQIDQLLRVKRVENIPDDVILQTVCAKLHCGQDGYPSDPIERRRFRLTNFFSANDPDRLVQVEMLVHRDPRSEEQLLLELEAQYGADELGHPLNSDATHAAEYQYPSSTAQETTLLLSADQSDFPHHNPRLKDAAKVFFQSRHKYGWARIAQ